MDLFAEKSFFNITYSDAFEFVSQNVLEKTKKNKMKEQQIVWTFGTK